MAPAQTQLELALKGATFNSGTIPVIANVDATAHQGSDDWTDLLARQLTGTVRFSDSIAGLADDVSFIELGAGGVLAGLIKRIKPAAEARCIATPEDLEGN
jgi:[acyl-carrier-protein] S-malonyltransferase